MSHESSRNSLTYVVEHAVCHIDVGAARKLIHSKIGLVTVEFVRRSDDRDVVISRWLSREHFEVHSVHFEEILSTAELIAKGYSTSEVRAHRPIWKRVPVYAVVLGVAAFLGALEAIGNHYDWLFQQPSLEWRVNSSEWSYLVVGKRFSLEVELHNNTGVAHRSIEIAEASMAYPNGSKAILEADPNHVLLLGEGDTAQIRVAGQVGHPGDAMVSVSAVASAGLLRSRKSVSKSFPAKIWPRVPTATLQFARVSGDFVIFRGGMSLGPAAPAGVRCEALFEGNPEMELYHLDYFGKKGDEFFAIGPEKRYASLVWETLAINQFSTREFRVVFRGSESSTKQLTTKVACSYIEK